MTNEEKLYQAARNANKDNDGDPIATDGTFESAFILGADYQHEIDVKNAVAYVSKFYKNFDRSFTDHLVADLKKAMEE